MRFFGSLSALGAFALVALSAACSVHGYATTTPAEPVDTTYITSAPVDNYEQYPHTMYEGRTVYYVNSQWGYPEQGHFVYYRHEPAPLVRYRSTVRQAPPAHPEPYHHEEYRNEAPRGNEAPPAERVR